MKIGKVLLSENLLRTPEFDNETHTTHASVSVLVVDDLLVANFISEALLNAPKTFTVEVAISFDDAMEALSTEKTFDLILLDVQALGMLGLKDISKIIKKTEPGKVCLLSSDIDLGFIDTAIERGAVGLIPKTMPLSSLLSLIDFVLSGQIFIPRKDLGDYKNITGETRYAIKKLNEGELRIIRFVEKGLTNKEIANSAGLSEMAVKMRVRSIFSKLNARNRVHAVKIVRSYGFI